MTIGYPLTDSVYDMTNRFIDLAPSLPGSPPTTPENEDRGADAFLTFINDTLRPWIRTVAFPPNQIKFTRDALYGHSFGGIFVVYALVARPGMFDTYIAATPTVSWNNGSLLDEVSRRWGTPCPGTSVFDDAVCANETDTTDGPKPAVFLTYGSAEQFPPRRRTETEAAFQERKALWRTFRQTEVTHELFDRLVAGRRARDVTLKEYAGMDHAGVASSTIADGIPYFVDW